MTFINFNRLIGSVFLISGTSIGAGMLGLPIKTIGINITFIFIVFILVWFLMLISSLVMLEISLWIPGETNIISISKFIFGKSSIYFIGLIYILFLYSLITAYISGGSFMLVDLLAVNCTSLKCNSIFSLIFISPFFLMFFFGFNFSEYINRFFFILLVFLYIIIVINLYGFSDLNFKKFDFLNLSYSVFSFPIILTSFGYSLLIPSLKNYLFNNLKLLFIAILVGSFIPLLVYIFWEYFIYCFLFNISNTLFIQTLFGYGNPAEKVIILIGNNNIYILYVISLFSLSALVSSLIGVSLSLYYFFIDLFGFSKNLFFNKVLCSFLVFLIPVFFSIFFPHGFMYFLSYAGAIASILLVVFPVYALWYGRYIRKFKYKYIILGDKLFLYILFFFGFLVFFIDLFSKYFI